MLLKAKIFKIKISFRVRSINMDFYNIDKYMLIPFYILSINKDSLKYLVKIIRKLYILNNIKTYILFSNDILSPESFFIDITNNKAYIKSCNITVDILVYRKGPFI